MSAHRSMPSTPCWTTGPIDRSIALRDAGSVSPSRGRASPSLGVFDRQATLAIDRGIGRASQSTPSPFPQPHEQPDGTYNNTARDGDGQEERQERGGPAEHGASGVLGVDGAGCASGVGVWMGGGRRWGEQQGGAGGVVWCAERRRFSKVLAAGCGRHWPAPAAPLDRSGGRAAGGIKASRRTSRGPAAFVPPNGLVQFHITRSSSLVWEEERKAAAAGDENVPLWSCESRVPVRVSQPESRCGFRVPTDS